MKHLFLSILLTCVISLTCHGQIVTLQHNGKITATFSGDNKTCLAEAFEHAEDGDTLFLSKGNYFNTPIINKSIAIIGVDASECFLFQEERVLGDGFKMTIDPQPNITISNIIIEGVTIANELYINSTSNKEKLIKNIHIRKSILYGGIWAGHDVNDGGIENATFESCKISRTDFQGTTKYLTFRNCEIASCEYTHSTTLPKLLNCDIIVLDNSNVLCINCIIGQVGKGITSYLDDETILINTLYHRLANYDPAKKCLVQDCYATENELAKDVDEWGSKNKLIITEEELLQNNYLGTDGTVVGKSGGARPYSLDMHLPAITKNKLVMDNKKKKVSINVSVTAN